MRYLKLLVEHKILSANEAEKVLKEYKIPMDKFPKIYSIDPQVVKLGAKPGDLIAINRDDVSGKYTYYRYVVEG